MATRVSTPGELLCVDELEGKITDLTKQVEAKKQELRSNFKQLYDILVVRENFLLNEIDSVVTQAKQAVAEKKGTLRELFTAKEGLERDLTKNKLRKVFKMHLRLLDDHIRKEITVGWVVLEWKKEQLEQSVIGVCQVITLEQIPVSEVDCPMKLCPVWSRDGTGSNEITSPHQLAIDDTTQNILLLIKELTEYRYSTEKVTISTRYICLYILLE